jgi:hypothetical protein
VLLTGIEEGYVQFWLAAFQPESDQVATIAEDGLLRLWDVPRPAAGDAAAIRQWVEAITGKELADKGILRDLDGRARPRLR